MTVQKLESRRLFSIGMIEIDPVRFPGHYDAYQIPDGSTERIHITQPVSGEGTGFAHVNGVGYAGVNYIAYHGSSTDDVVEVTGDGTGPVAVFLNGNDGNDTLSLNGVAGGIDGGRGYDVGVITDTGFRTDLFGGPDADILTVIGDCLEANIQGDAGWQWGTDGNDTIRLQHSDYPQRVQAGGGANVVYGSDYDDIIDVTQGAKNRVYAGFGDDLIYASNGSTDITVGGAGTDTVISTDLEYVREVEHQFAG
jgi:uncharacterized protein YaiE (UPF0345 family)